MNEATKPKAPQPRDIILDALKREGLGRGSFSERHEACSRLADEILGGLTAQAEGITVYPEPKEGLTLREVWASGHNEDGVEFDFTRSVGGITLFLDVKLPDGRKQSEKLHLRQLLEEWVQRMVDAMETEAAAEASQEGTP